MLAAGGGFLPRRGYYHLASFSRVRPVNVQLPYRDRRQAGQILADRLRRYILPREVLVLGLARGGIPVGYEIAVALNVPFDVFLVRKLGVPGREELAMGAIASGGVRVLNSKVLTALGIQQAVLHDVTEREKRELTRRESELRGANPAQKLAKKTIILVDDGLATGASMRAAIQALRLRNIEQCIVAVPVGAPETCAGLQTEADEFICLAMPKSFRGVGQFYEDFRQTTDHEVRDLLLRASKGGEAIS